MQYDRELAIALEAANLAGDFIRTEYETFVPIPNAPVSISTHVDRGSQELILQHLAKHFPEDGICAEESTESNRPQDNNRRRWVVDPIDGTRGFVMKNGQFSVMVGLTVDGVSVVGVVLEPTLKRVTYAQVGGGCWSQIGDDPPVRCQVRTESDPTQLILVQSRPKDKPSPAARILQPKQVIDTYSAGVKMAIVARGEGDTYVNRYDEFCDWDICAGHVLVTEAGGVVSGLEGQPIVYGSPGYKQKSGLLASSKACHEHVVGKMIELARMK